MNSARFAVVLSGMKNWKKILLLLVVLSPSFFFLSRAFGPNRATLDEGSLSLSGPGSFKLRLYDIDSLNFINQLPQLAGSSGFSLGWIKKGDFIRKRDRATIRLVKNRESGFIFLRSEQGEAYYFNLADSADTGALYRDLRARIEKRD